MSTQLNLMLDRQKIDNRLIGNKASTCHVCLKQVIMEPLTTDDKLLIVIVRKPRLWLIHACKCLFHSSSKQETLEGQRVFLTQNSEVNNT